MTLPRFGRIFAASHEIAPSICLRSEGTDDHIHLLLALPAGRSLSDGMRDIKANSSRFIRTRNKLFASQDGYAGVSVSPSQIATVKAYIADQAEHHRRQPFEDEYLALLKGAGASFDPDDVLG